MFLGSIPTSVYKCPHCAATWYRHQVGEQIPNCPVHTDTRLEYLGKSNELPHKEEGERMVDYFYNAEVWGWNE